MTRTRHACPRCGHHLRRVHRTPLDYAVNLFVPLKRLRCSSCGWSGTIYRPRPTRRFKERVNENVIRRRMLITGIVVGLMIFLIILISYLTLFVWSTPPRPPTVGALWRV